MLEPLFDEVAGLKRLQHGCFPVKLAKFLRTPFLQNTKQNICWEMSTLGESKVLSFFSGFNQVE